MDWNLIQTQTEAEKRFTIAFTAIMIWDWLVLLPAEVKYIWRAKRMTPMRVLYLANRYISLVLMAGSVALMLSTVSKEMCSRLYWVQTLGLICIVFISDVLLALRVIGLYENSRRVIIGLCFLLGTQLAFMVAVGAQLRPFNLMNVGFWIQSNPAIRTFGIPALVSISSTLSSRLALSLHIDRDSSTPIHELKMPPATSFPSRNRFSQEGTGMVGARGRPNVAVLTADRSEGSGSSSATRRDDLHAAEALDEEEKGIEGT